MTPGERRREAGTSFDSCFGTRWRDGTTHVAFEPVDFVARLAALVPPPRFHLVRYHGVLRRA